MKLKKPALGSLTVFMGMIISVCNSQTQLISTDTTSGNIRQISTSCGQKESEIRKIFSVDGFDPYAADAVLKEYLENSAIERIVKTEFIWELVVLSNTDENKIAYLLDSMRMLHPLNLTNRFIDLYNKSDSIMVKQKVINLLGSSIRFDSLEQAKSITNDELKMVIKIQKFLKLAMDTEVNPKLVKSASQEYSLGVPNKGSYNNALH